MVLPGLLELLAVLEEMVRLRLSGLICLLMVEVVAPARLSLLVLVQLPAARPALALPPLTVVEAEQTLVLDLFTLLLLQYSTVLVAGVVVAGLRQRRLRTTAQPEESLRWMVLLVGLVERVGHRMVLTVIFPRRLDAGRALEAVSGMLLEMVATVATA